VRINFSLEDPTIPDRPLHRRMLPFLSSPHDGRVGKAAAPSCSKCAARLRPSPESEHTEKPRIGTCVDIVTKAA